MKRGEDLGSKSEVKGLSEFEALKRLKKFGPNKVSVKKNSSWIKILLAQLKNTLILLLILATAISLLIGEKVSATIISIIIILNILLGFFEDFKAEKSMDKLREAYEEKAVVIRDGKRKWVKSELIVPGDIIILKEGMKIPADAELIESNELLVNESALTGESQPVYKKETDAKLRKVLAGTFVVSGHGLARVEKTGRETEFGKIIESVNTFKEKKTPLQKELNNAGKVIGSTVIILSITMFLSILYKNHLFAQIFHGVLNMEGQRIMIDSLITAIALAVAAVPEGLPTIVTLALSFGSKRMLKSKIFVKRLSSVETLGSVDTICSDKTGTITEGKMRVTKTFFDNKLNPADIKKIPEEIIRIIKLCNDSDIDTNESPTEKALLEFAKDKTLKKNFKKIMEVPFSHEKKFMITVHKSNKNLLVSIKGAPEIVLGMCSKILINGKIRRINKKDIKIIKDYLNKTANESLRNIGFAFTTIKQKDLSELKSKKYLKGAVFAGFASLEDQPRKGVKEAIAKCKEAGIKPIMITGDYKGTAISIGKEVGITGDAMGGDELNKLSEDELVDIIEDYAIFYRVLPSQKLKILKALQNKGHIVAMTGDGVNDAPTLKKADIGIAVNSGTDVAKDSADMILLDNSFTSIVRAVEEGRRIYSNIKKSVRYLLSSNLAEVGLIFLAVLFGLPLPLIAVQILWMNLLTDSFPAFSLTLEPAEEGIMKRKPRTKKEGLLNHKELLVISFLASVMSLFSLFLFTSALPRVTYARTTAFTAIVLFELANVINSKSETRPSIKSNLFSNKLLWYAIGVSLILQTLVVYLKPLNELFETQPLSIQTVIMIISFSLLIILSGDIIKLYLRISNEKKNLNMLESNLKV